MTVAEFINELCKLEKIDPDMQVAWGRSWGRAGWATEPVAVPLRLAFEFGLDNRPVKVLLVMPR